MTVRTARLMDHLNRLSIAADLGSLSDCTLLARFLRQGDHGAFAALVARHGPMVYNVCYRQLGNAHAAEDAFQAAFFVLARKATTLRCDSLAAWLHGVAVRIALNARRASRRTPVHEEFLPTDELPDTRIDPLSQLSVRELLRALEEEVQCLPSRYRLAVVLCCLEGLSQEEAAHRLGWTVGSVKGRLERGRARLRSRLMRRGLAPAAAGVMHVIRNELSAALAARTVKIALADRGLLPPSQVAVSGEVLRLAEDVLKGMTMFKWKWAVALAVGLCITALGTLAPLAGQDKEDADKKRSPVVVTVDLNDGSRVVGKSDSLTDLRLRTSFGEVRIPIGQVAGVQFKDDQGTTVVRFHNGDQVTGTLDLKALGDLKVATALGETTVPLKLVTACKIEAPPSRAKVTARASSTGEDTDPNNPFQHDNATRWNSGGFAPAWIEADLGAVRTLDRITLVVGQDPKGETEHEIWVSDEPIGKDRTKAKRVHTFFGETENDQELKFTFPASVTARYVQIRTTESPSWVDWHNIDLQVR